jgi:DNA-binding NarL/FixJ family response regulator
MKDCPPIRVVCIDDHPLILAGVKSMLHAEPDLLFVGGAATAQEGLALFRTHTPDVTLVDLRLKGTSGTVAIADIRREFPEARIIAMTTYKGDEDIHRALAAGARGYILKDMMHKDLVYAIHRIHDGGRWIAPEAAARLAENSPRVVLTHREREVLCLVADGNRNKEIGDSLKVTEDTVKFHVKSILSKLGVNDRTHAVTVALKRGILHID